MWLRLVILCEYTAIQMNFIRDERNINTKKKKKQFLINSTLRQVNEVDELCYPVLQTHIHTIASYFRIHVQLHKYTSYLLPIHWNIIAFPIT